MPHDIQLSDFEKGQIIGMHELEATMTFIAAALNMHELLLCFMFLCNRVKLREPTVP
ncbi:26299_t:CDS:1, partial [Dentiscutata erythropus]